MSQEINFQLTQNQIRSRKAEIEFNLSESSRSQSIFKTTRETLRHKKEKFSRKKLERPSVQKFRSKSRSLKKEKTKIQVDNKQLKQKLQIKPETIKKNFLNIYNIEHRNKKVDIGKQFGKGNQRSRERKENKSSSINIFNKENTLEYESKYIPDIKNYNTGKLLINQNYLFKKLREQRNS